MKRMPWDALALVAMVLLGGAAVGFAALWERGGWCLWSGWFYLGYAAFWSFYLLTLMRWHYKPVKGVLYGIFLLALVVLWAVPWNAPKRFALAFQGIQPGMEAAQVRSRLEPLVRGTGWPDFGANAWGFDSGVNAPMQTAPVTGCPWPVPPSLGHATGSRVEDPWAVRDGTMFFPGWVVYKGTPYARDLNAEFWIVHLRNGKVTKTEYLPD